MASRFLGALGSLGSDPDDSEELAGAKRLLVLTNFLIIALSLVWVALYWIHDERLAAAIPGSYIVVTAICLVAFGRNRRFPWFRDSQLLLWMLLPVALQLTLGGFIGGSAATLWSLFAPLGALAMVGPRRARPWFATFLALNLLAALVQPSLPAGNNLPESLVMVFFLMNIVGVSAVAYFLLDLFVGQLHAEREKSESLLLNVLPAPIAARLRQHPERVIAERFNGGSVLFADVVGFTPLSARVPPEELVDLLNEVFSAFDRLADQHGVEKIKTIGDSYMAAAGVPVPMPGHARAIADLALGIRDFHQTRADLADSSLRFRVGINTGPLVAGVIGRRKFTYDLWGDTVNTASRMASHGEPGKIQLTEAAYLLLKDDYVCVPHGMIEVKGKGPMATWYLEGRR